METRLIHFGSPQSLSSERTFPLEGNGNTVPTFKSCCWRPSERTFPLEGNGNIGFRLQVVIGICVRKDFPVGREWKLASPKSFSDPCSSERTFPVEGNGNFIGDTPLPRSSLSERTFPVEGNGNKNLSVAICVPASLSSPKGLSRWKGMETRNV